LAGGRVPFVGAHCVLGGAGLLLASAAVVFGFLAHSGCDCCYNIGGFKFKFGKQELEKKMMGFYGGCTYSRSAWYWIIHDLVFSVILR